MSFLEVGIEATALNPERHFFLRHIRFDKQIVRAEGCYLHDSEGNTYLDALSQYGAMPLGHNPAPLWAAIEGVRLRAEPAFVQPLLNPGAEALATRLLEIAPDNMRHVTFVNSGAEANEAAIKLAHARTGRQVVLSVEGGFHGKTLGALSCTGNPKYREPFLPDTTAFEILPFGDLERLEARLAGNDVAALHLESIQGEGGMRPQPPGYLAAAQRLCHAHGALLVLDEVQSGLGRTGLMFGFEREPGVQPDIILLSKALGGGLMPLGAVLCSAAAWSPAFGMYHSSTFANSHLGGVVGSAVIDALLADDCALLRNARTQGALLRAGLDALVERFPKAFAGATGDGLMQGLVLQPWTSRASYFTAHASQLGYAVPLVAGYLLNEHKILTAPLFNQSRTLRLQPALNVGSAEIARVLAALEDVGEALEQGDFLKLFSYILGRRRAHLPARPASAETWPVVAGLHEVKGQRRGSFAFLIHPIDENGLMDTLPPEFGALAEPERSEWIDWMRSWFNKMHEPAPVIHAEAIVSREGGFAEGWLIACPLTPSQMLRLGRPQRAQLMHQYLEVARKLGVDIVGLGAFTSVISDGGQDVMDQGQNLTTGNSLTAIASAESIFELARLHGLELHQHCAAVVGAAGSVGRLAAIHLSTRVAQVVLVGNANNAAARAALEEVAGEIYARAIDRLAGAQPGPISRALQEAGLADWRGTRDAAGYRALYARAGAWFDAAGLTQPASLTLDVHAGLAAAQVVLSATSAGKSFIDPASFRPGAIVCDAARPLDVLASVQRKRSDVLVFEGGVMHLPDQVSFGRQNILGYPRGLNLACLSETLTLALEGVSRHFSLGKRIDYDEALWIWGAASRHGFSPHIPRQLAHPGGATLAA